MPTEPEMVHARWGRSRIGAMLVVVLVAGLTLLAPPARAQTPPTICAPDDPYGCLASTTTLAPGEIPTPGCRTSASAAAVGERVTATVTGVPEGTTVTLQLGGQQVASGTAAPGSGYGDVTMAFTVPDLPPGNHALVATGAAFFADCAPGAGFQVLAAGETRSPRSGDGGDGGRGGGSLARTGLSILGFLLVAAVLITIGRMLQQRSRRHAHR